MIAHSLNVKVDSAPVLFGDILTVCSNPNLMNFLQIPSSSCATADNAYLCSSFPFSCDATLTHIVTIDNQLQTALPSKFNAALPREIGLLTNLKSILLGNAGITGRLPVELSSLVNLEELVLYDNQITGPIIPGLASLVKLIPLDLGKYLKLQMKL